MEKQETIKDVEALEDLYHELNSKTPDRALKVEGTRIYEYMSDVERNIKFAKSRGSKLDVSLEIDAALTYLIPLERIIFEWRDSLN